jgi:hypothetical protein
MAMKKCKDCQSDISTEAKKCPQCGRPNKPLISGVSIFIVLLAALFVGLWLRLSYVEDLAAKEVADHASSIRRLQEAGVDVMQETYDSVSSDAVAQYRIAKQQGDPIQVCVQAGLVSAAYLQAKKTVEYNKWKAIEKSACRRAGIP